MGDYTRFTIDVKLQPTLPVVVYQVLKYLTTTDESVDKLIKQAWNNEGPKINHPFFECSSWECLFSDSCVYLPRIHQPSFKRVGVDHHLMGSGSWKNRDDMYEKFIDWLRPYMIVEARDQLVAYTEFDSEKYPKVSYILNNKGLLDTKVEHDPNDKYPWY